MKKLLAAGLLLTATMAFAKNPSTETKIKVHDTDHNGVPTFVTGELGQLGAGSPEKAAKDFLKSQRALLKAAGTEDFEAIGTYKDGRGETHVRLQQRLRGLPVVGAEYIVHSDKNGKVLGMNGRFAPDVNLARNPLVDGWTALTKAAGQAGIVNPTWSEVKATLLYVVNDKGNAFLAWRATASHKDVQGQQVDRIYADATTGDLVVRDATIHRARNRNTYNANFGTSLPGSLVMSETSAPSSDVTVAKAHEYAGVTYDYFKNVHNRDSYNGAGATIISTVHYSSNYNNAGWTGTQMLYGDGDGSQFGPFARALDVVSHELAHAVTDTTADLVYQNESGALNEATSDVFGAAAEAWKYGSVSTLTWKIGEDCYTPGTAGDALRYMNDPAAAGDYDYYPTRYTGTADYGGVHSNSGIANLAFYLMTVGGTHPRGKTTVNVPALNATAMTSIDMAAKIWFRALTVYMTSSTNFAGARTATAQSATDLYGAAAADSVNKAWDAVGAPGGSTGGGTTTLANGVAVTSQSASTGTWKHFKIAVPTGQSKLEIIQSGGTGDADLYVKRGAQPTSSVWDYRPYLNGNAETVTVTNPVAGDWFISIYAYSSYSGLSIKATYSTTTSTCTTYTGTFTGSGQNSYVPASTGYVSAVSGAHTGKLTGPSGTDFDVYLQKLSGATWSNVASGTGSTSTENVTYNGTAGTYRWRVYSYSGSGAYSLCTTKP
jgi:Zn-dependent metalloprotease